MMNLLPWGYDLLGSEGEIGLESFDSTLTQVSDETSKSPAFFKPINIVVENGIYYVTIYLCSTNRDTISKQKLMIWLSSLKETDYIKLNVASLIVGIPIQFNLEILGALSRTKATVDIQLDNIVSDELAYFYLIADKVTVGSCGGLFIPSYIDTRREDKSSPWRAVHDFLSWIVEQSVSNHILTHEEAELLDSGKHVIVENSRFTSTIKDD